MGIGVAASLPWKDIVLALPGVAQTATELWKKWKSRPEIPASPEEQGDPQQQIAAIVERLESLEQSEAIQSGVVKQITEQLQAMSMGLAEVSRRSNIALMIAAGSLLLSVVTVAVVLLR